MDGTAMDLKPTVGRTAVQHPSTGPRRVCGSPPEHRRVPGVTGIGASLRCSLVPLESLPCYRRAFKKVGSHNRNDGSEKELEAIFGEVQRSYEAFANDAFALQERTLGFA
jgi:hypothetical protein